MKDRVAPTGHVGTAALGCPVERSSTGFACGQTEAGQSLRIQVLGAADRFAAKLKSFFRVFAAALREIFDESAYARFLSRRQWVSSRAAYAAFRLEHETAKARRPRCC